MDQLVSFGKQKTASGSGFPRLICRNEITVDERTGSANMGLTMTRPEKAAEMSKLVYAIREAAVAPARDGGLNLAEVVNAFGQALASILVGAYNNKNREVVLSWFPDLVRAYYPQWEKIYAAHGHQPDKSRT